MRQGWIALATMLLAAILVVAGSNAAVSAPTGKASEIAHHFAGYEGAFVLLDAQTGRYQRYNATRCAKRYLPCSTFKIPNSVIALDTGVASNLEFPLKWDGEKHQFADWNRDHTLRTAFPFSVVWYYQELARRIGPQRMQQYVRGFQYGNQRIGGGIDQFWLTGDLRISANEQVEFLNRLRQNQLPASPRSMELVRELMVAEKSPRGVLRGKTGTQWDPKWKRTALGWYVGWVDHAGRTYLFATNISGGQEPTGATARRITREILTGRGWL